MRPAARCRWRSEKLNPFMRCMKGSNSLLPEAA